MISDKKIVIVPSGKTLKVNADGGGVMVDSTKVLCVGFSVTEEKEGYVNYLSKGLKNIGVGFERVSIGGATFKILPYILPEWLSKNKGCVVLFEIATCYRFSDSIEDYEAILTELSFLCRKYACKPVFVNMYRGGVDFQSDKMSTTIEYFSKRNGFEFIDLISHIDNAEDKKFYLRDNVHPTVEGAKFYAKKILSSLTRDFLDTYEVWNNYRLVNISDLVSGRELSVFKRGGFESSYVTINSEKKLTLKLPEGYFLSGLMYLMGPKSGAMSIKCLDTGFSRTIQMYDERSYYKRCSYQFFPPQKTNQITLEQKTIISDINPIKGEKDVGPRIGSVIGILVARNVEH